MPMPCLSQIAIPVVSVTHIKKTKTAILVPNALVIATANDRVRGKEWNFQWFSDIEHKEYRETGQNLCVLCLQYVFVSLLSRDNTYKVLMSVCLHLEVGHTSQRQQDIFPFISTHGSSDRQLVPTKPCDCGTVIEPIKSMSVGFSRPIPAACEKQTGLTGSE